MSEIETKAASLFILKTNRLCKCRICGKKLKAADADEHVIDEHEDTIRDVLAKATRAIDSQSEVRDLNKLRENVVDSICAALKKANRNRVAKVVDDFIAARVELAVNEDFSSFVQYVERGI